MARMCGYSEGLCLRAKVAAPVSLAIRAALTEARTV